MKTGEIKIEALRLMDPNVGRDLSPEQLSAPGLPESYRAYLCGMIGSINRCLSDIEVRRVLPPKVFVLTANAGSVVETENFRREMDGIEEYIEGFKQDVEDGRFKGDKGDTGATGSPAGFGLISASASGLPAGSDPVASVSASGPDTGKNLAFTFGIPKGKDGTIITVGGVEQETFDADTKVDADEYDAKVAEIEQSVSDEETARQSADNGLQGQIDALVSRSDVVDVVGTYAELEAYDTSSLGENDVVKVLTDSTHDGARSYYRWAEEAWNYVGSEAVGYTKAEADTLLNAKQDVIGDLSTIRSGADSGATALQPSALTPYRTAAAQDVIDGGKVGTDTYAAKVAELEAKDAEQDGEIAGKVGTDVYTVKMAAIDARDQAQDFRIANLKAAVYGTVIGDAEHTFEYLDEATLPTHVSVGGEYHKVFDGAEMMLKTVGGKTKKYNQYVTNGNVTRTVAPTNYSSAVPGISVNKAITAGTYAIVFDSDTPITFYLANSVGTQIMSIPFVNGSIGHNVVIKSLNSAGTYLNAIRYETSATETTTLSNFCIVNLTDIYGAGNEPSTAEAFLADYPEFNGFVPPSAGALKSVEADGVRINGESGDEAWKIEFPAKQTLNGAGTAGDVISVVKKANGLFDVVKTAVMGSADLRTFDYSWTLFNGYFYAPRPAYMKSYGDTVKANAICPIYETATNEQIVGYGKNNSIGIGGYFIIRDSTCADVAALRAKLQGVPVIYELAEPVTTVLMADLTEQQVACLTEAGGSIEIIGNGNSGFARPDVTVVTQIEKAVEV